MGCVESLHLKSVSGAQRAKYNPIWNGRSDRNCFRKNAKSGYDNLEHSGTDKQVLIVEKIPILRQVMKLLVMGLDKVD